jgi:hypothetical protein
MSSPPATPDEKDSILPKFLTEVYLGFPLWQWLILLVIVTFVLYYNRDSIYNTLYGTTATKAYYY